MKLLFICLLIGVSYAGVLKEDVNKGSSLFETYMVLSNRQEYINDTYMTMVSWNGVKTDLSIVRFHMLHHSVNPTAMQSFSRIDELRLHIMHLLGVECERNQRRQFSIKREYALFCSL